MPKSDKLQKAAKRVKLSSAARKLEKSSSGKSSLYMDFDADIKAALQKAYGRNLTKLFEELAIEKLERDGHLRSEKAS